MRVNVVLLIGAMAFCGWSSWNPDDDDSPSGLGLRTGWLRLWRPLSGQHGTVPLCLPPRWCSSPTQVRGPAPQNSPAEGERARSGVTLKERNLQAERQKNEGKKDRKREQNNETKKLQKVVETQFSQHNSGLFSVLKLYTGRQTLN